AGHAARPNAQREPAEPPGPTRLAGPRRGRPQVRPAVADEGNRPEPGLLPVEQVGRRCPAGPGAVRRRPAEAADADADGDVAQDRFRRPADVRELEAGGLREADRLPRG